MSDATFFKVFEFVFVYGTGFAILMWQLWSVRKAIRDGDSKPNANGERPWMRSETRADTPRHADGQQGADPG